MSIRQQKVESQVRRLVSEAILRELSDPRVNGLLSVTRVSVSPDLREARVYISILSDRPESTVMSGLVSARGVIQKHVADGMKIRYAPRISFLLDESLKRQAQVLKALDAVSGEEQSGTPGGTEIPPAETPDSFT
ncbi:MAG: 30S ribosome-binding factor RbfA [Phycisphaerae bacterium]